jgi:tRNA threonylcarbamoyladenosine biosynthesis protein TsaE
MMTAQSQSLTDTKNIAEAFISGLILSSDHATVVGLRGDLGSGKTAFVQQTSELLGVTETVTSPTFVIEKIYKLDHSHFAHLIHIDAYRLESDQELLSLGWKEIIADPKNLIMIEWPEKVPGCMPSYSEYITFTFINDTTRDISYERQ